MALTSGIVGKAAVQMGSKLELQLQQASHPSLGERLRQHLAAQPDQVQPLSVPAQGRRGLFLSALGSEGSMGSGGPGLGKRSTETQGVYLQGLLQPSS